MFLRLGALTGYLGRSWGHLGQSWGHLGLSWGHLGLILASSGRSWALFGAILASSWPPLGSQTAARTPKIIDFPVVLKVVALQL